MRSAAMALVLLSSPSGLLAQGGPPPGPSPMSLQGDLRDAPRPIFHPPMRIPARPGRFALRYPKWIPGEHGPNGKIGDVGGLVFTAGGKRIPWHRDSDEMFRILVEVPPGASEIEAQL